MTTEAPKRRRSPSDESANLPQLRQPSAKLPKTSHNSLTLASPKLSLPTPFLPSFPNTQVNYLSRRSTDNLPMVAADDSLPVILRLIGDYDTVLQNHESLAGYLGVCTLGPMLARRFERLFDAPPKVLKSPGKEGTNVSWLDVVEFARTKPELFNLEKTRDGSRACQIYTKRCRVEISEDDYRLIKSGMPQRMIPPQPILEDEEQEFNTLEVLEKRLEQIIQLADQVSARARQLNNRLKSRRSAISARRQSDVHLQSHVKQQQQHFQQLQQADHAAAAAAAVAGRTVTHGSWPQAVPATWPEPKAPRLEPENPLTKPAGRGVLGDAAGKRPLMGDALKSAAGAPAPGLAQRPANPAPDAARPDRHLENILSATNFFQSGSVPENVTIINGTSVKDASPATRNEMVRKFLTSSDPITTTATERSNGVPVTDGINHNAEDNARPYRALPPSTAPHPGESMLHMKGSCAHHNHPLPHHPYPYHQQPQYLYHAQPRLVEANVPEASPEHATLPSSTNGTSAPPARSTVVVQASTAPFLQHPVSSSARAPAVKAPSRPGQQAGRSSSHSTGPRHARDDGAPFKMEMIARLEELQRGDKIFPPCDRCRRLQMDCSKNLTACWGCTKKHAKCSWKDVKIEELQGTAQRSRAMPTMAGLVNATDLEDRRASVSAGRQQNADVNKRNPSTAKSPLSSGPSELVSGQPGSQPPRPEREGEAPPMTLPKLPPIPSQHEQHLPSGTKTTPAATRAASISIGALASQRMPPLTALPPAQQGQPTTSPVVRPHSVEANPGYTSLPGYRAIAGSPSSAPSALPAASTPEGMSDQLPPLNMTPSEQRPPHPSREPDHAIPQRYQSGVHLSSFSRFHFRSPEEEKNKGSGKDADERTNTHGSPRNRTLSRDISRRPDYDPLSVALSDTVTQHMAARATAELNASRSASGRLDSASATSASPRFADQMAMTPVSAVAGSGSAANVPPCTAAEKNAFAGNANATVPSMGPMLSPSSGPGDSKRAPSPFDIVANDAARFK